MNRRVTYDCVLKCEDDGWTVEFPQLPEAYSEGDTRAEALRNAADVLLLAVGSRVKGNEAVPRYKRSAEVVSVSVELTDDTLEEMAYASLGDAADYLEVSRSRISNLIKSGVLEDKWFGGAHKVSIESLNRYRQSPRKAGRPLRQERELAMA